MMEYDLFGGRALVERAGDRWRAWFAASDGKRLAATNLRVPADDLLRYFADHHAQPSPARPDARRMR